MFLENDKKAIHVDGRSIEFLKGRSTAFPSRYRKLCERFLIISARG